MDITERDRSRFDYQGCLVVPGVRSDREVSELCELIDSAGLWDGAPGSTSHSGDLLGLGRPFWDLMVHPCILPYLSEWPSPGGACPDRAPLRAAGLQAAPAGGAGGAA